MTQQELKRRLEEIKDRIELDVDAYIGGFITEIEVATLLESVNLSVEPDRQSVYANYARLELTREEFAQLKQVVSGDWEKTFDQYSKKVRYSTMHNDIEFVVETEPPASCKVVEEEVHVPARTEKRARLVCKDGEAEESGLENEQHN